MTDVDELPAHVRNSISKAELIARGMWRRGLWMRDLAHLPKTSKRRADLTLAVFARTAFRESPDPKDHERQPPGDRDSLTWVKVAERLAEWETDPDAPPRDLLDDHDRWLSPARRVPTQPAPELEPDPELPTLPRGWAELAALPPIDNGRWCIHHPGVRPVVITLDGGRCGDCPPRPNEWMPALGGIRRDGWGMHLDWTPKTARSCAPARCWCGRCPGRDRYA